MNIIDDIINKLNNKFNGKLICEQERADLFVYIDGKEETITAIDTNTIFFENEEHNVNLWDADIQHLVYINDII